MSNNKSIRILRGTRSVIDNHSSDILEYGQPLFDTTYNYLYVGRQGGGR